MIQRCQCDKVDRKCRGVCEKIATVTVKVKDSDGNPDTREVCAGCAKHSKG